MGSVPIIVPTAIAEINKLCSPNEKIGSITISKKYIKNKPKYTLKQAFRRQSICINVLSY